MKTVFLKELRENARWASIACAIVFVWTYIRLVMHEVNALIQVGEVLDIMAPLTGLALGVAQAVFETRPDNWAFAVHRPIRRGALFAAKSLAGLLLVYAALVLPVLICAFWAARPGHAAMPFHWRLTLAPMATVLAAALWYFGGIVVTLRRARWYGSRLLPLGLPLVGSAWTTWVPGLWMSLLGVLVAIPLMAAAAWGAFSRAGNSTPSFTARLGLGAAMLPGCLMLVLLVANLAGEIDSVHVQTDYSIERDGRHVVVHMRRDSSGATSVVMDTNGRPLPEYAGLDEGSPVLQERWVQHWAPLVDDHWIDWPSTRAWTGYRAQAPLMLSVDGGYPPGYHAPVRAWLNRQRRVIELYDKQTRLLTGTIGPGGFAPAGAEPKGRFPDTPLNITRQSRNHTLAFGSVVYWLELEQQRLRPIFVAQPDDPVLSAGDFDPPDAPQCAAIMTEHRLHIVDPSGRNRLAMSAPLEFDHGRYSGVAVARLPANGRIFASAWWEGDDETVFPTFEFAPDGTLLSRTEFPPLPAPADNSASFAVLMGLGSPVLGAPVYRPWRIERLFHIRRLMGPYWDLYLRCMIAAAVASAIATLALSRWYGHGSARTAAWMLGNLLLGPSGVAVLLSLSDRPIRERCPACRRDRPVEQTLCPHCEAPHAAPEQDGREIFEPCDGVLFAA
jgi:hypothetical protein